MTPVTSASSSPAAVPAQRWTDAPPDRTAARTVPALDGVRGVAILLVLAYHFAVFRAVDASPPPWLAPLAAAARAAALSGWMGVDLFFVLSGFLITGILYDTRGGDRYWRAFYARRALRILPLYYLVVAALLLLPTLVPGTAALLAPERAHAAWYWLHGTNILFVLGAWASASGHLWSLAIEEQFYLVWPFVVRWSGRVTLPRACGVLVASSVALRAWAIATGQPPAAGYMLTPLRLDALAAGALLAVALRDGQPDRVARRTRRLAVLGGVVLVAIAMTAGRLFFLDPIMQLAGFPAAAAVGAGLVHVAATTPANGIGARLLGGAWLRWLGRRSYALYLFQQPLLLLWRWPREAAHRLVAAGVHPSLAELAHVVIAGATLALLAEASWRLVERPALSLKRHVPYAREAVGARAA